MATIRRLCVYCGSAIGDDSRYHAAAHELGTRLAEARIGLVFGGGRVGLMGVLADAVLAAGGHVTGVIPAHLRVRELAHPGASEMLVVANMHERKRMMAERADAFAVLPGGVGTLDELFETVSWRQLGLHDKPILLVDVGGYWQKLEALIDHLGAHGFAAPLIPRLLRVVPDVAALMEALAQEPSKSVPSQSDLL